MGIFASLFLRLLPLYLVMGAGGVLCRKSGNVTSGLAAIQIYLIAPVIVFANVLKLQMSPGLWGMPFVFFLFTSSISVAMHYASSKTKTDYTPVLAQASGASNTGYLGVPVAMLLFPADWIPTYFFVMVGGLFYESTIGYYWIARGKFSVRGALISMAKLPTLYALLLGLAGNFMGLALPASMEGIIRDFMGSYVILGALIIGMAVAQNKKFVLNARFAAALLSVKFLLWPFLMWGITASIASAFPSVPKAALQSLLVMSIMPLAANSAAFASLLKIHAEETATVVALSTVLSLLVVPSYVLLFGLG